MFASPPIAFSLMPLKHRCTDFVNSSANEEQYIELTDCLMDVYDDRVKRSDLSNAAGTCGSSREDVRRWMEQVQNSAVEATTPSSQVLPCFTSSFMSIVPALCLLRMLGCYRVSK